MKNSNNRIRNIEAYMVAIESKYRELGVLINNLTKELNLIKQETGVSAVKQERPAVIKNAAGASAGNISPFAFNQLNPNQSTANFANFNPQPIFPQLNQMANQNPKTAANGVQSPVNQAIKPFNPPRIKR